MSGPKPAGRADLLARPEIRTAARASRPLGQAGALAAVDVIALAVAAVAAGPAGPATAGYALAVLIGLAGAGTLRLRICLRLSDQVGRILAAAAGPAVLLLPWLSASQAWRLAAWSGGCLLISRGVAYSCVRIARRRGLLTEPALLAGAGETGALVASALGEHPELGLRLSGVAGSPPRQSGELSLPVLGGIADLPRLVGELGIWRVIVCPGAGQGSELVDAVRAVRLRDADIVLVPDLHELGMAVPRARLDEIWGIPVIPLRRPPAAGLILKRAADLVVAAVLLCLLGPVILSLVVIIRLISGRPAIFRQLRVTSAGRAAQVLKLRTLTPHGNSDTSWSVPMESCTRFGRWLRVSHLDELPQLVNVVRGQMSLVGPRPERPYFAERFGRSIPGYPARNRMRAGLTGLAQVSGLHGDTSLADRIRFDNQYIEYWSPALDLIILARTAVRAIAGALGGRS